MKKILLFSTLLLASASMMAQGFDGSFDEPWETCYPDGVTAVGQQPKGWMASNVYKNYLMPITKELVAAEADRTGDANGYSVKMFNEYVGMFGIGATAPGYITLGQAWAYGDIEATMDPSKEDTSDGGSYGGVEFTTRPDSLTFYVKRTHLQEPPKNGSFNKEEKATVVFYAWTGSSTSKVTTGLSTSPVEIDMVDRDQDILGKKTEGVSGDAQLVAANEYYIEGDVAEWARHSFAVDYKQDVNPEKMNLIFSASDYFNRAALGTGNALMVDDVQFIYNSRLKSLTVGGEEVPGFNDGVFAYQLSADRIDQEIKAEAFGKDAEVVITKDGNVTTIVVTDNSAKGEKTNTYTLTFKGITSVITLPETVPAMTYGDMLDNLGFTSTSNMPFTYSFSVDGVLEVNQEGKLCAVGAGEVLVTACQEGNDDFTPAESEPLKVVVDKAQVTVSLSEDSWCWRGSNVSSYNETKGFCDCVFSFEGLKWNDAEKSEAEIFAKVPTVKSNASKDGEAVGDMRAATLSGGEAFNYELVFAEDAKIKVVKNQIHAYVKYATSTLSADYNSENYRTVKVAAGQDEYIFTVEYTNAVYDDKEVLAASANAAVVCAVNKDAQLGEEFPVSLTFGQTEFEKFDLVNVVPAEAKVVVATNPNIVVSIPEGVKYGDVFQMVSNESGITSYNFVNNTSDVVNVSSKGEVTVKQAGSAEVIVRTNAMKVDDVEYGATTTRVKFETQKAPLTITAKDVTITTDDAMPEAFELTYEGWVGTDTEETVFIEAPKAVVNLPETLVPGEYPIEVVVTEAPANYEVKTVNGVLLVKGTSVSSAVREDAKVAYADGNLYVPCGGQVEVYALTGALVGRYEGTVIPVALRANTLYIVKTENGAYRLLVK